MTSHSLVQCHMYAHVDTVYTITCIYIGQSHTIEITITCIVQHDVMCKGSLTSSMFLSHLETLVNVLSFVTSYTNIIPCNTNITESFIVNRTGGIDLDCVGGEGSVRIENIPVLSCSTVL